MIEWFHSKDTIVFATELPMAVPFQMDKRVLLVCVGLSVLSAFLCGLAPALQSTRVDLVNALKSADVDVPGRKRLWGRNMLVVAQVSMSLMLLTAAFLMARGFEHDLMQNTGFRKDHLLMTSFDPRLIQYNATPVSYTHLDVYKRQVWKYPSSIVSISEAKFSRSGGIVKPSGTNVTPSKSSVPNGIFCVRASLCTPGVSRIRSASSL